MRPVNTGDVEDPYLRAQTLNMVVATGAQRRYTDTLLLPAEADFAEKVITATAALVDITRDDAATQWAVQATALPWSTNKVRTLFIAERDRLRHLAGNGADPDLGARSDADRLTAREAAVRVKGLWPSLRDNSQSEIKPLTKFLEPVYPQARRQLIRRVGGYCSYCELPISSLLAIEHTLPKATFPGLMISWDNFLLACSACNTAKGARPSFTAYLPLAVNGTMPAVSAAARTSMRFPHDADYYRFSDEFMYVMRRASRQPKTPPYFDPLSTAELFQAVRERRIEQLPSTSGVFLARIVAQPHRDVAQVSQARTTAVRDFLGTNPPVDDDEAPGVALGTLPEALRLTYIAEEAVVAARGGWRVAKILEQEPDRLVFDLEHVVPYEITFSTTSRWPSGFSTPPPGITGMAGYSVRSSATKKEITGLLQQQVLPPRVTSGLRHYYWPRVRATASPDSRDAFRVRLYRRYRIWLTANPPVVGEDPTFRLRASVVEDTPLELAIKPVTNPPLGAASLARRQEVINVLGLNDDPTERPAARNTAGARKRSDRIFDRRVYRRTYAWFLASRGVMRLDEAAAGLNDGSWTDGQYNALRDAVKGTMKATGCATVWAWVITGLGPAARARDDLRDALADAFPGTRVPPPPPPPPPPPQTGSQTGQTDALMSD